MSAATNYLEYQVGDHIFRGQQYVAPTALYVGLVTYYDSGLLESGDYSYEMSGGSYDRVEVISNTSNWSNTSGQVKNSVAIEFPEASSDWGLISGVVVFDTGTSGNLLFHSPLNSPKTVVNGDTYLFPSGQLIVNIY